MSLNVVLFCGPPRTFVAGRRLKGHDLLEQLCTEVSRPRQCNHAGSSFYIVCNGRKVDEDSFLDGDKIYHIVPRVFGGKGGFGSMLRAIGAQIEKTTSREACRDLSGRRMRDINNEKKLKEWLAKEADREREKEERRQERLARHLNPGQHKFDDPKYHEQRTKVQEDLQDALHTGLKRAHKKDAPSSSSSAKKMKVSKSSKEWLGVDIDSDELDSESDTEAHPGSPSVHTASTSSSTADVEVKSEPVESSSDASHDSAYTSSTSEQTDTTSPPTQSKQLGADQTGGLESNSQPSATEVKTESDSDTKPQHTLLSQLPPASERATEIKSEQTGGTTETVSPDTPVDLDLYKSSKELAALGLERLKCALMSRGLKCGGTLEERAERLFSVCGLSPDEIDPSLLAKSKGKGKKSK